MRILERCDVVVAPTLTYHHYPAFVDYPGSTSLRLATAQNLTVDVCQSLARLGPRRFYALNTGISTLSPLERAASSLARQQILLRYTNMPKAVRDAIAEVSEQEGGNPR
jgi:creatinine amidohydrolase